MVREVRMMDCDALINTQRVTNLSMVVDWLPCPLGDFYQLQTLQTNFRILELFG